MPTIDSTVAAIAARLEVKNGLRDRALIDSRRVIRFAANGIRALHRGEYIHAAMNLRSGQDLVLETKLYLADYPDLYWSGYVQDAQKELAEASLVLAMIRGNEIEGPDALGVECAPYLNGMAEAASEMRRYVLDTIRVGGRAELEDAERILSVMDDVYTNLITVDFPDALTGGLRRTVDALRAVLERTRGDLTISARQAELARALESRT